MRGITGTLFVLCVLSMFDLGYTAHSPHSSIGIPRAYALGVGIDTSPEAVAARAEAARKDAETLDWTDGTFWSTGFFLVYMTSWLVGIAASLLNESIEYFVVSMGAFLSVSGGIGTGINAAWTVIRDIVNLTFVFGLIYLAFMTIANADTSKLKHGVANILIGALLVNFSMFFAKAIVDVSNVTAITIYQNMDVPSQVVNGQESKGIAYFFMERLGLVDLLYSEQEVAAAAAQRTGLQLTPSDLSFPLSMMISVIFIVTSFVFIAGAVLIAIRFVVLTLLIIVSPIAFVSAFVPKVNTEELSHSWWDRLIAQAMFAPAYFLLLWISTQVVNVAQQSEFTLMKTFTAGSVVALMNFIMVIGFLVGSLIVAKKFGAVGSTAALAWGKSMAKGTGSFAGRWAIGGPASGGLKAYDKAMSRMPKPIRSTLYHLGVHDAVRGGLEGAKKSKFGGSHSWESRTHDKEVFDKQVGDTTRKNQRLTAISSGSAAGATPEQRIAMEQQLRDASVKELEDLGHKHLENPAVLGSLSQGQFDGLMKSEHLSGVDRDHLAHIRSEEMKRRITELGGTQGMAKGISKASAQQLKSLGSKALIENPALAAALSSSQMDDLKKDMTETEFGLLKEKREEQLWSSFDANQNAFFTDRSSKEVSKLPKKIITDPRAVPHLDGETLKKIADDGNYSKADREAIADNITRPGATPHASATGFLNSPRGASFMP